MNTIEIMMLGLTLGIAVPLTMWRVWKVFMMTRSPKTNDEPRIDQRAPLLPKASFHDGEFAAKASGTLVSDVSVPMTFLPYVEKYDDNGEIRKLWWDSPEPIPTESQHAFDAITYGLESNYAEAMKDEAFKAEAMKQPWYQHPGVTGPPPKYDNIYAVIQALKAGLITMEQAIELSSELKSRMDAAADNILKSTPEPEPEAPPKPPHARKLRLQ